MFDFLPRLAVERPVLTTMLVVMSLVLGLFGFSRLQTDLFPEVEFPVVSVSTVYPGAGPEEIETQVTDRIEEAVSSLAGIDALRSFSQENVSIVIVQFDLGVNPDQAAIDVRDRIEAVSGLLPAEVETPVVQKFDFGAFPIIDLALSGPLGTDALYEIADQDLRERFSRVPGVAGVQIVGGRSREVEVLVSPERLQSYGITLPDIINLIQAENVSVPSGRITEARADVPVRVVGEYRSAIELEELRLFPPGGQVVRLGDIAVIREGYEDASQIARFNGEPAVSISIQKRSDANPVNTAAGVRAEIERMNADLPVGTTITIVRDGSEFIEASIRDVLFNLVIGIILTTLVLFLFLHSWRGTIIAAAAMPVTIISTFLLMDAAGFTLNVMTLMALSITVGILVTNTIVVLENIYRHLDLGEDPRGAAHRGTAEIGVAVAASTLTNLVVFTPIAFMEGIIGQFFYAFGLTVVFATIFSIFISFTLAPLLAARLLRTNETELEESHGWLAPVWRRWDKGYRDLEFTYRGALEWALARPRNGWIIIASIFVLSISSLFVAGAFVGGEFIPSSDEGAIRVELELPSGTPLDRTGQVALLAEQRIATLDDVASMLTTISGGGGDFMSLGGGANNAQILVTLREGGRTSHEVLRELRPLLADLPDATITAIPTDPSAVGPPGAPIQLQISGPDYGMLRQLADQLTAELMQVPQLSDVTNSLEEPRTELVFRPNRAALADYGLTVGQVGQVVRSSIAGTVAGVYRGEVGRERDIRVRLAEDARQLSAQVGEIQVRSARGAVSIASLGALEELQSPTAIQRVDRVRTVEVEAQIGQGALTDAVGAINERMEATSLPPGYTWRITGEFENFGDALGAVLVALILAITLTYIVLAMILESFIHPFTIMLTLPLGAVGAFLGLFLWGASINIFSMMAIIMLVGIVVNNAILILDYTAQLRREGRDMMAALLEAAPARLRPIVMSNIAIVFALIPQAVGGGAGANFRVPMAVVTIGGVLLSAVFTLFLIPVIYTKLDRFSITAPAAAREPAAAQRRLPPHGEPELTAG
ncbi:MAG TPA: efflux RND transporter permease subunit [Longimicrobiales bacterium]|nr:efflux RND transporter permease subunit [Longimicrobiales bacterium]